MKTEGTILICNQNISFPSSKFQFVVGLDQVGLGLGQVRLGLGQVGFGLAYCLINVHKNSPKKCPRNVIQKMSTKSHPKRRHFVDIFVHEMSPKVSTRCHPFCPRNVTYYVHEMSATHVQLEMAKKILLNYVLYTDRNIFDDSYYLISVPLKMTVAMYLYL